MSETVEIRRYPNRRLYSRNDGRYVSLSELEAMIREGKRISVTDSQSGEDLTREVLIRILVDQRPEKMRLLPTDMLHFMLRSNDLIAGFLRDYFGQSLTYLEYLQQHRSAAPMHWMKAWMEGFRPKAGGGNGPPTTAPGGEVELSSRERELTERVAQLETRLEQLEAQNREWVSDAAPR